MAFTPRRLGLACATLLAVALAACQGSGGTGGLTLPQTSGYGNPNGPTTAQSASRQQVLEGTVTVGPELADLPLPSVAGFAVTIALGATPRPVPSGSAAASGALPGASPSRAPHASPTPSSAPSPSPSPSPGAEGAPSPAPSATGGAAAKTSVKTTIYPDDAPPAPTPAATGDVVTLVKRVALVRGFVSPASDLTLYGLGAVRVTIPSTEQTAGRGFTLAAFQPGKKHHDALLASDAAATLDGDTVTSTATAPLVLKKGVGYAFVLYGDELPSTPAPSGGGYPAAGNNPFPTPTPTAFPGVPNSSVSPNPYGSGAPGGPPGPYATPNPYGPPH